MNEPLRDAIALIVPPEQAGKVREIAADVEAAIKAAIRAVVPGRQQAKNLTPLLEAGYTAAARAIRRRASKR